MYFQANTIAVTYTPAINKNSTASMGPMPPKELGIYVRYPVVGWTGLLNGL